MGAPVTLVNPDGTPFTLSFSGAVGGGAANGAAVSGNPVLVAGYDGTLVRTLLTDSAGRLQTIGAYSVGSAAPTAQIAGAIAATDGTNGRLIRTDASGNVQTIGSTASGSSLTVSPVTVGGRAATANPTAVADGQVVNAMFDKLGKQVSISAVRTLKGSQNTIITASTSETTIVTQAASTFLDLYGLILANTGATTTKVDIRDTTGGAIIATIEVPTLETRGFMLPADSGFSQTAVNTNWTAQCGSSTSSLQVTALYVKNI